MATPRSTMAATPRSARKDVKVPFLPGMALSDPKKFHRVDITYATDTFKSTGTSIVGERGELPKLDLSVLKTLADPFHRFNMTQRSETHEERHARKESARNSYRPAISPAWLKHDRQVLRFYAYFQEPVHENPMESFRVRQCVVYFYLEDGTMMVMEPKIENSGVPQGTFVKRHRIAKSAAMGGGFYSYHDLRIGVSIEMYARVFRLVDCDEYTRHFYEEVLGTTLPEPEDVPMDFFQAAEQQAGMRLASPRSKELFEMKQYNELTLGGSRRNAKLEQYLENDRKVLRFKCYWDDSTAYGSRMYYTLHFYLSDDTVEMLESLPRNSGRDVYPTFWKRSPLRKNPFMTPAPAMLEPEPVIYKPEDIIVGQTVSVYSRDIMIYDCDDFTREFYRQYMNFEQESFQIQENEVVHVALTYPPHTGIGTEEDSLASCLRLRPRPPPRDVHKLMTEAGKVMRFEARIATERVQDESRRFIVGIYLADEGVCVWELKQRNSGFSEGKFSQKSRKRNPATGKWFTASEFYVGAIIEISATPFLLTSADEWALHYMEENLEKFPVANPALVAKKLSPLKKQLEGRLTVTSADLQQMAEANRIDLVEHEIITLERAFGEDAPGYINLQSLRAAA